jgi:hypothetical protein
VKLTTSEIRLGRGALAELEASFHGRIIQPGDLDYQERLAVREEVLAEILQRDGLPCERSSEGSDHAAFLLSSGGRRLKTCPVFRRAVGTLVRRRAEGTPKDLCGRGAISGSKRALPAATLIRLGARPLVRGHFQQRRRTGIEPACELSPAHRF